VFVFIVVVAGVVLCAPSQPAEATLTGYFNSHRELLVPVKSLKLPKLASATLFTFGGKTCGKLVGGAPSSHLVFDLTETEIESVYVLKVNDGTSVITHVVKADATATKTYGNQTFDKVVLAAVVAAIALVSSFMGFLLRSRIEDRKADREKSELFRLNLDSVAIDLASGSSVDKCLTRERLIPNDLAVPASNEIEVYRRLLVLAADVAKLTDHDIVSRRHEIVERYFEATREHISINVES
jgi:hypothetical protein